jgi:histidinol phosphatase-like PHP family hydrolase
VFLGNEKVLTKNEELLEFSEFYEQLINTIKKFDVKVSFGSDAHQVVDIGDLSIAVQTFERFNFSRNRVLNFLDEDCHIKKFSNL